jgi:hypothetical protein
VVAVSDGDSFGAVEDWSGFDAVAATAAADCLDIVTGLEQA